MPTIHPTSIVEGDVQLADDVIIGPNCVLTGPITIGAGCQLVGNVYLHGPITMGEENIVYPFSSLGFAPQHAAYDRRTPGLGLVIGKHNIFREQVTVHRAFTTDGPTTIGDHNTFMVGSHVGHDSQVGNQCVMVNSSALGGHVIIEDSVTIGGGSAIHQFVRVGEGVMITGHSGASQDVPPNFMVGGINACYAVNIIGMRRRDIPRDQINDARWAYRTLYRCGYSASTALNVLRERIDRPMIARYVSFIEMSARGICGSKGQALRSGGVVSEPVSETTSLV